MNSRFQAFVWVTQDLAVLLAEWDGSGGADLNHDGLVNGQDLAIFLAAWG